MKFAGVKCILLLYECSQIEGKASEEIEQAMNKHALDIKKELDKKVEEMSCRIAALTVNNFCMHAE